ILIEKISSQAEEMERRHSCILSSSNSSKGKAFRNKTLKLCSDMIFLIVLPIFLEMLNTELEDMLQRENLAIFISNIQSDAHLSSRALTEIERRHQDIISLEYTIKELHEIFTDTAMLLEIQGELINNIEKNVTSAGEYVDVSKEETNKALLYKKNPYKIASLPRFFKPFRRQSSDKTAADENSS
uniref:Syntaxin-2 n=1 Tax=Fundulus heteroclitus TaxID=8078 RepID=A0A3Q2PDI5_FUNHE